MRSNLMTFAMVVAGVVLAAPMATANDAVQEQLRLMEERMAEMEDRLQATSQELQSAKATVDEQQDLLSDAGLVEGDENGVRSGVGSFLEMVDISGVVAASYNYRFLGAGDNNQDIAASYRHPNANTFALDQMWLTLDKAVTEESRAGFHADIVYGETAEVQGGDSHSGLLFTGYVSYLAPLGDGVQFDAGKLASPLGAESLQTNQNFNITQGAVYQLQPIAFVGVAATTEIADGVGFTAGVVNDIYTDTSVDSSRDKAGFAQLSFSGDEFGVSVGAIVGKDNTLFDDRGAGNGCRGGDDCNTSLLDIVMTASPSDNVELWLNFDWARSFGNKTNDGDAYGLAGAGRLAVTDETGLSTRLEYIRSDSSYNRSRGVSGIGLGELFTWTTTVDHELTEGLKIRGELRWDRNLANNAIFANGSSGSGATSSRDDQLVGLAEIFYEF